MDLGSFFYVLYVGDHYFEYSADLLHLFVSFTEEAA
jgi:hypothetical protein